MVISIGEILVDIFRESGKEKALPGGAPFNVASNIAFWNGDVTFYGSIGDDKYGELLSNFLKTTSLRHVIDVSKERYTTQAIVTLDNGERSFKFVRDNGADYALDINKLDSLNIKENDIVHIGSLMLSYKVGEEFFFNAVKYVKAHNAKVSFDVNYRSDIFESEEAAKDVFLKAIRVSDILKFTEEELLLLTGVEDIKESLKAILNKDQIAVVTLGKDGSLFYGNGLYVKVASKPVKPVDTTGAGDAFYSYFLYALNSGLNTLCAEEVESQLKIANAMGALATQRKGAIGVVPTVADAKAFMGN